MVSAIPGTMLFCIPPALVFVTGALFVPWMYSWAAERMILERNCLAENDFAMNVAEGIMHPSSEG
jgi:hypothetical protein